ncbi:MAG: glycosyltransferase [Chitinivibrionales bacterium]|nr:glycosyltransferase [Chitinivibrionales bacterium]MBD3395924.1 glycosyltransferase [Chitinivibrionales bacterium]
MSKERIGIVVFEPNFSGQGRAVVDICNQIGSRFDFYLVCQRSNAVLHELCRVLIGGSLPLDITKIPGLDLLRARRFFKANGVSLIHLHGFEGLLWGYALGMMTGIPVVYTPHTIDMKNRVFFFFYRLAWRICSLHPSVLITASHADEETMAARRIIRRARQKTILYGIDRARYASVSKDIPSIAACDNKKWIVQVGHLSYQKNPLCFIRAVSILAPKHDDLVFMLVGEGPLRGELRDEIVRRGLESRVLLLGYRNDALAITRHAWVVVNTSRWEGMPFTLIDACFLGKAIVASAVNGINDLVKDGVSGLLFRPDNERDLAQKIEILLCHESLRKELGAAALRRVRDRFTLAEMGRQHAEVYRAVAGRNGYDRKALDVSRIPESTAVS